MTYSVKWNDGVLAFLDKLQKEDAQRIVKKIDSIKEMPFNFLEHYEGDDVFKLRIGNYRALIDVDFSNKLLKIRYIEHRKKVYKRYRNL